MATKNKSNVTKRKKSNVTPKKVTQKQLAAEQSMSTRTYRNREYMDNYLDIIFKKVDGYDAKEYSDEVMAVFSKTIQYDSNEKKNGISMTQIKALSELPADELREIIFSLSSIIKQGGNVKAELARRLPQSDITVTVTLPSYVNQWYADKAKAKGMSKGSWIKFVLCKVYENNSKSE